MRVKTIVADDYKRLDIKINYHLQKIAEKGYEIIDVRHIRSNRMCTARIIYKKTRS